MRTLTVALASAGWLVLGSAACAGNESAAPGFSAVGGGFATTSTGPQGGTSAGASSGGAASTSSVSTSGPGGSAGAGQGGDPLTASECFADDYVTPLDPAPSYDPFGPTIGTHCLGTNHQDIDEIERVVFLGDSITVGTPPNAPAACYRSLLADALVTRFGLEPPSGLWKTYDPFSGQAAEIESGAFASCATWGARASDLLAGDQQIAQCFSPATEALRTLVIMTVGGNDLSSLTHDAIDGASQAELWATAEQWVATMRQAIEWFYEPSRFPSGAFVIFANLPEFTDGTGEVQSCDTSGLAGFDEPVPYPAELAGVVRWLDEQYLAIAVENQADMIFMFEHFCGHGFNADDPGAPCYRGPGQSRWFDLTCIHPNPTGHAALADMFLAVVGE